MNICGEIPDGQTSLVWFQNQTFVSTLSSLDKKYPDNVLYPRKVWARKLQPYHGKRFLLDYDWSSRLGDPFTAYFMSLCSRLLSWPMTMDRPCPSWMKVGLDKRPLFTMIQICSLCLKYHKFWKIALWTKIKFFAEKFDSNQNLKS